MKINIENFHILLLTLFSLYYIFKYFSILKQFEHKKKIHTKKLL